MFIKLKDGKTYAASVLREERVGMSDNSTMWNLRFVITDTISSDEVDTAFTEDNISEITAFAEDEQGIVRQVVFGGYTGVSNVSISFNEETLASRCAVLLTKTVSEV